MYQVMRITLEDAYYCTSSATKLYEFVMQVWPVPFKPTVNLKALEPIGRELKTVGKVMLLFIFTLFLLFNKAQQNFRPSEWLSCQVVYSPVLE